MFILSLEFAIKDKNFQYVYYYYYYSKWLKSKCNKYKLKFSDKSSNKKNCFEKFHSVHSAHSIWHKLEENLSWFKISKGRKVWICQFENL